ncbi:MAG: bifunctional riboflavin kinase/FAD synthetase [Candidatus Viridilinea halotolerans]|uniref:Riboflavin biosynthesis protein n=1 Tax=Candidatus Viridilinea halotolerans TaxID=2491704 RepID=A0A426U1J5_9CHLR|nr:MAG: bifunctional riboflavin kinase/FAD synthetase [Candidatus Viridilinea halotolerans]
MGKFDGLHLGHQRLITTTIEHAAALGLTSAVLTWDPHPYAVLRANEPLRLLTPLAEKIELIAQYNPDRLIIAPFTPATMASSARNYMAQVAAAQPLRELWVGEGFAMGRERTGDIASLMLIGMELGFAVGTVSKIVLDGQPVSSSRVRALLARGAVSDVTPLLGRPFSLRGIVVQGDQRGRTLGFPTANLAIPSEHLLPADGVYACHVCLNATNIPAVTNIGIRPTFDGLKRTIETHLLDWSGDLYGQTLSVAFIAPLRGEQKFSSLQALIAQIGQDVAQARRMLGA